MCCCMKKEPIGILAWGVIKSYVVKYNRFVYYFKRNKIVETRSD